VIKLHAAGWRVVVIWECEIGDQARIAAIIEDLKSIRAHKKRKG
jgi:G:T-mismatch repair DNA endonuclease (very short patch repair protein)